MSNRCEDYPCCGHTDGLGCNYTPDYAYINAHALCDHEAGICDLFDEDDEDYSEDVDDDFPMSMEYPMEDQYLDTYMEDMMMGGMG